MSNLKLQNLSYSRSTNSLTKEETSCIVGGFAFAGMNFSESLLNDVILEDLSDIEASPSFPSEFNFKKTNSKPHKSPKGGKPKANNVIIGTPGDDVLIGN
ncbi:MAG: hypothetical protein AAF383_27215 [Cyanobacteria bacterium P01_A01_bin.83]